MNTQTTITVDTNQLHSLLFAVDMYRSHWFDNYLKELNVVDKIVYERAVELCQSIKEQVNDHAQLDA